MAFATLQHLRSFNAGQHPQNLEPGQIAMNMAVENFDSGEGNFQMYMYVGNGTNTRYDQGGTVLVNGGEPGKGWVRYHLRSLDVNGDTVHGDFNVSGSRLSFEVKPTDGGNKYAELIVPSDTTAPPTSSYAGSVRWNEASSMLQAWDGAKWSTTSKVAVSDIAPSNPSNGDLWLYTGPPVILYVYVVPSSGPASWVSAISGGASTGLQPGNGVTSNEHNQIDTINLGSY